MACLIAVVNRGTGVDAGQGDGPRYMYILKIVAVRIKGVEEIFRRVEIVAP